MGVNKKRMETINQYLSKENLEKYLKIYSANYIAKKLFFPDFTTNAGTVIDKANQYGIPTHGVNAHKLPSVRQQYIDTCQQKYNCDNVSQSNEIKKIRENSVYEKYGVTNVFQLDSVKAKKDITNLEKYGTKHPGTLAVQRGKVSKFHSKIEKTLHDLNIEYQSEVHSKFIKFNDYLKKEYSPIVDILLNNYPIVIECYGDFWHANPKTYKHNDIFDTWEGKKTAQDIWDKDKSRIEQIQSFGYTVIIIWESEFNKSIDKTKKRILNEIKKCENKINKKNKRKSGQIQSGSQPKQ